jgi:site-specific DNA recombinase
LIDEATFHRVQAVLSGRISITSPRERNRPDFPLRGFVRCESCGRPLTASWSKGRSDRYAYYHCRGSKCRAVNITKTQLEGLFAAELKRLQPTAGYMRLLKDTVLRAWQERKATVRAEVVEVERKVAAIRKRLDQLDDAFLFAKTIDIETYDRHRERLRGELTLAQIDRHSSELEEFDVQLVGRFPAIETRVVDQTGFEPVTS